MSKLGKIINRIMDIVIAFAALIILSPIIIVTSLAIWWQDHHSPIYKHKRVGKNKEQFDIYKFRSMVINADEILFNDPNLYKQMRSGSNKVKDDPRVTKVGKFIRKYSIDEVPQMINVIKGDMCVVGPRALRPDEFEGYELESESNKAKLKTLVSVKPGITGYWQVSGRSEIDFDQRMEMECYYAKNKSILFDLKVILKTPIAVVSGGGAY